MKKLKKLCLRSLMALILLYLVLLIPDTKSNTAIVTADKKPFFWNRDNVWQLMEQRFKNAKALTAIKLDSIIRAEKSVAENKLSVFQNGTYTATDTIFTTIENNFFSLAALVAAKPGEVEWFTGYYNRLRSYIKLQSQYWDMNDTAVKNEMYALLYGMRSAVEEVLLQSNPQHFPPAMMVMQENSVTPFTQIFGIEVHSGDLLVSRGGAEVSALISRGNDYPGNFSHVALIYIDTKTNTPYLIEAHIEKGVAVSTVEQYVKDKKLRFMVLRLRNNLPAIQKDKMLPQKAAQLMYDEALRRHIPYDFKMNFYDSTEMFCSEVGSYAYRKNGVQLWKNISTISSQGVVNWLQDFGVENFVTQMPSDLEYDPQLTIVAEWRDPETLYKDHIDNAAMDALLEKADKGQVIGYNMWMLPVARTLKAYCWLLNRFGKYGIIPEGMSATRALKNETFVAMHKAVKIKTEALAADFEKQNGYRPPYWQLIKFAEAAAKE
ncbi:YiiX/YebB-like N1pC/P60 family cysteine hydrolase [Ferruginibacter sp. SUN106]|uniref:YiiX/YebB-like N1pC/P60 family cysteine hydrolase n=1 Tax=Ferruginibacter sp. SUN106 TaxID=2978348 RepID=UPI003D35FCBF